MIAATHGDVSEATPRPLRLALLLMLVGAAASLTQAVLTVVMWDRIWNMAFLVSLTPDMVTGPFLATVDAGFATGYGLVVGVLGLGLWLWMARSTHKGRRWVRVVAIVFGCLAVVSLVVSFAVTLVPAVRVSAVVVAAIGVATVVLLHHRDSAKFLTAGGRG